MKLPAEILLFIMIGSAIPPAAAQKPDARPSPSSAANLTVRPTALGPLVENQSIKMMLRDGTYIEGKVHAAMEDTLMMTVKHSEPQGRVKKGDVSIPTRDISVVYLRKKGSAVPPIVLGVAGGLGGLIAGSWAGYGLDSYGASVALGIGFAAAGATGGAYLGMEVAKRDVTINVAPPPPGPAEAPSNPAKH